MFKILQHLRISNKSVQCPEGSRRMEITQEMNRTLGGMSWSLLQFAHNQAKQLPHLSSPRSHSHKFPASLCPWCTLRKKPHKCPWRALPWITGFPNFSGVLCQHFWDPQTHFLQQWCGFGSLKAWNWGLKDFNYWRISCSHPDTPWCLSHAADSRCGICVLEWDLCPGVGSLLYRARIEGGYKKILIALK